jgi:hypothetical protein
MENQDRKAFADCIQALAAAFRTETSPALFESYWMGLDDLPLNAVLAAVKQAARKCRFMPVPAELRELAGAGGQAAVLDAWQAVVGAIRSVGHYRSVDFGPVVNAVVRNLGGWRRLCDADSDELHSFLRKDFERIYATTAQRPPESLDSRPLLGEHGGDPVRVAIGPVEERRMLNGSGRHELEPVH